MKKIISRFAYTFYFTSVFSMPFKLVIWLEIHLKLNSPNKLFCSCPNIQDFDDLEPNTHVCPVCTGQPGALPVLSKEPLAKAIQLWLALGCHINEISSFDRKSYFYPDLPMGYQITQQYTPTNVDGEIYFFVDKEFSKSCNIRIHNAHIETDTGKTIHTDRETVLLDYNRAGTPLVEIVTHPDFRSADEVIAFLQELQRLAKYNQISDAEMEKGQMRVDVNISLREERETSLRTRVEMKNMSSFSAVRRAIDHEEKRQSKIYEENGTVDQETRGWDDASSTSYVMRSKEDAMDYRYMPEADMPPIDLDMSWIDEIRDLVVESPYERMRRYKEEYGFNKEYINGLIGDVAVNKYFEQCVEDGYDTKLVAKWIVGPIARRLTENEEKSWKLKAESWKLQESQWLLLDSILPFSYEQFTDFLQLQMDGELINQHAKTVMKEMLATGKDPKVIIDEKWLKPVDEGQVKTWVEEVFSEKPELLEDLKSGNMKPMWFVVGQVMKKSGGSADPGVVNKLLLEMIGK